MVQIQQVAQNIFVTLNDLEKEKYFVKIKKTFSDQLIARLVKKEKSIPNAATTIGVAHSTLYNWRKTRQYPLLYLMKIVELTGFDKENLEKNIIGLRSGFNFKSFGGGLSKEISLRFPIRVSAELARIIARVMGAGCLSVDCHNYLNLTYYNQSKELRDSFKKDMAKVFGVTSFTEGINKGTEYVRVPSPVGWILLSKIDSFHGAYCKVPEFIISADLQIQTAFLGAFFDDECHIRYKPPSRDIQLALSNELFLIQVREMLLSLGIKCSKIREDSVKGFPRFTFYIRGNAHLKEFVRLIPLLQPNKKSLLKNILRNPGRISYSHGETRLLILDVLQEGYFSTSVISERIKRSRITGLHFLRMLEKEGLIKRRERLKTSREIVWMLK